MGELFRVNARGFARHGFAPIEAPTGDRQLPVASVQVGDWVSLTYRTGHGSGVSVAIIRKLLPPWARFGRSGDEPNWRADLRDCDPPRYGTSEFRDASWSLRDQEPFHKGWSGASRFCFDWERLRPRTLREVTRG